MEDKGLGNIIFYIILALLGLAGSFTGKKKKASKPGTPGKTISWPDFEGETTHTFPDVFDREPAPVSVPEPSKKASYGSVESSYDGNYDEPMAGTFSGEGSYRDIFAEKYSSEGSMTDELASRYSTEGMLESPVAAAFRNEGTSSLIEAQIMKSAQAGQENNEIYNYDYNKTGEDQDADEGFDVRRAVLYSALLNRKEYSF